MPFHITSSKRDYSTHSKTNLFPLKTLRITLVLLYVGFRLSFQSWLCFTHVMDQLCQMTNVQNCNILGQKTLAAIYVARNERKKKSDHLRCLSANQSCATIVAQIGSLVQVQNIFCTNVRITFWLVFTRSVFVAIASSVSEVQNCRFFPNGCLIVLIRIGIRITFWLRDEVDLVDR